ncbi:TPA: C40 family peptidase [Escherichia coli]|nr:C40 family peptidase [Escherichia coli]HCJ8610340.1 C40 family peptidase [Escherichia coli]
MAQERALQITFVGDKYGYSDFPYEEVHTALVEGILDRVAPMRTFQVYSNFGRIRCGRNNRYTPVANDELKFNGIVRDDEFTGEPLPETAEALNKLDSLPIIEFHSESGELRCYYPARYAYAEPLTGRIYDVFKSDCWSLCREWLIDNRGIRLPAGTMQYATELTEKMGRNFFIEIAKEQGFREVLTPKEGDVVVLGLDIFHTCIYLEGNRVLHMFPGRLSAIEAYDGWLEANTQAILRYQTA